MSLPISLTTHREVYKASLNRAEEKANRAERVIQIRKQLQRDAIHAKRFKDDPDQAKAAVDKKQVDEALEQLKSKQNRAAALTQLRGYLCRDAHVIQWVIDAKAVPLLIEFLTAREERHRLEAVWCLTNLASGTAAQASHVLNAAPFLLQLIDQGSAEVRYQAMWTLGNVLGDDDSNAHLLRKMKRQLLAAGLWPTLLHVLALHRSLTPVTTWVIGNLLRGVTWLASVSKGPARLITCSDVSALVQHCLAHLETLTDTCHTCDSEHVVELWWLLATLYQHLDLTALTLAADHPLTPVNQHVIRAAIQYLTRTADNGQYLPVLRVLDVLLVDWHASLWSSCGLDESSLLSFAARALASPSAAVQCECLFLLANMTAGHANYRALLARDAALLGALRAALTSPHRDVTREALFVLVHLSLSGQHASRVIDRGAVQHVLRVLADTRDSDTQLLCVTLLEIAARYLEQGPAWLREEHVTATLSVLTCLSRDTARACALFASTYRT